MYFKGIESETTISKLAKFRSLLETQLLNLDDLRHLSWSGIPVEVRPTTWRLLAVCSITYTCGKEFIYCKYLISAQYFCDSS